MNYKNRKIIELAQAFGYNTASELADFLKNYNPIIKTCHNGKESIHLSI